MTKKYLIIASCVSLCVGSVTGYLIGHKIATDFEKKHCDQHLQNFIIGSAAIQRQKEIEKRNREIEESFARYHNRRKQQTQGR